jgi:hypothetical protein
MEEQWGRGNKMGGHAAQYGLAVAKWGLVVAETKATTRMAGFELVAVARAAAGVADWLGAELDPVVAK